MDAPAQDHVETLMFHLAYCSRATQHFEPTDLDELVAAARRKNSQLNITGWLVHSSGIFFQLLEGERAAVKRLMAAITVDPRHNTVVILSEDEEVRERLFSSWDMELVPPEDIRSVLMDAIGESKESQNANALKVLLKELDSKAVPTRA